MTLPQNNLYSLHLWETQGTQLVRLKSTHLDGRLKQFTQLCLDNDKRILRFTAKFNTRVPEDLDRRFIISFYLADDTIGIYESAQKNSGIIEGKFLHRRRYKNVDNNNAFLTLTDMPIGGNVKINGHSFNLLSADEFTNKYL